MNRIPQPPRIFFYRWKFYITWRIQRDEWINAHIENKPWQCVSENFVFIGFNDKLIGLDSLYYDGHTVDSITFLGLIIGKGFTYNSKELACQSNSP